MIPDKIIDYKLESARKLFKKHDHRLADCLTAVGEVQEINGELVFKGCTFNLNKGGQDTAVIIKTIGAGKIK